MESRELEKNARIHTEHLMYPRFKCNILKNSFHKFQLQFTDTRKGQIFHLTRYFKALETA